MQWLRKWPDFDRLLSELRAMPAIEDRAQRAAEAMARQVLANERDIRALIALSYAPTGGGGEESGGAARPAFRVALVDAVLAPFSKARSTRKFSGAFGSGYPW